MALSDIDSGFEAFKRRIAKLLGNSLERHLNKAVASGRTNYPDAYELSDADADSLSFWIDLEGGLLSKYSKISFLFEDGSADTITVDLHVKENDTRKERTFRIFKSSFESLRMDGSDSTARQVVKASLKYMK